MADKLFAITATSIEDTCRVSFAFIINSGVARPTVEHVLEHFGTLTLRNRQETDDPALPPEMLNRTDKKWEVFVFNHGKVQVATGHVNEDRLHVLLRDIPDSILLVHRDQFDQVKAACENAGIELGFPHFEGELRTS